MQNLPADHNLPENGKRKHEPNFIAASIACPTCIQSGSWKETLRGRIPCKVCGNYRNISFSHRPFYDTNMDKQIVTEQPLAEFAKWILYQLPIKFETVAYSHFGGNNINLIIIQ